jgi:hypothetical protein
VEKPTCDLTPPFNISDFKSVRCRERVQLRQRLLTRQFAASRIVHAGIDGSAMPDHARAHPLDFAVTRLGVIAADGRKFITTDLVALSGASRGCARGGDSEQGESENG